MKKRVKERQKMLKATVLGAGLAGCEAAFQLANAGVHVTLIEQKPVQYSKAHKNPDFAELICSNSLKAERLASAGGLLKAEMRLFGSVTVDAALKTRVPSGGALSVNRDLFAKTVTNTIQSHKNIEILRMEATKIPKDTPVVIATGPLTEGLLSEEIATLCGGYLSFYDAAAPIVTGESIDMDNAFFGSRYDRGGQQDYINCPLERDEYEQFYNELVNAKTASLHEVDQDIKVYEGCMPVEIMAKRGKDTLRYGPLKPVGLTNPKTGKRAYAVVQLRREDVEGSLFNMVGFQTNLKFPEQKRVFSLIPALKNAEFMRYGVMHRNTFINSPKLLNKDFSFRENQSICFAGQITGVEGYMESAASGMIAGLNLARRLNGQKPFVLPAFTMIGALCEYVSSGLSSGFQPMGANFGILPKIEPHIKNKQERYEALSNRSINFLKGLLSEI